VDHSSRFDELDKKTQGIVTSLIFNQDKIYPAVLDQTVAITQLLGRIELLADNQKSRTDAVEEMKRIAKEVGADYTTQGPLTERIVRDVKQSEVKRRLAVAEAIIGSLWFPAMTDREEAIEEAHQETFKWIFEEQSGSLPWDNFVEWLINGSGVYWVNGKAASGKSTLMRYIHNHPQTIKYLEKWASPLPLTTYRFYFWNSGTLEQRSHSGLLRAILSEALKQNPDLAPILFPTRWAENYLTEPFRVHGSQRAGTTANGPSWSLQELMTAFNTLVTQKLIDNKICLFIDGLDEYDGDHCSIANLFKNISETTSVKVCVSSRPLLVFDDAFALAPSLRLQVLTHDDISKYVTSNFQDNIHFQRLVEEEPEGAPELMETIVSRADGVFLWVKLVVLDLLKGLGNRDDLVDLRRRLDQLPVDLEELFKSMLNKIEPFYMDRAAEIFLVARAAHVIAEKGASANTKPIPTRPLDSQTLSLAIDPDPGLLAKFKIRPMSRMDEKRRHQRMNDQLKVRCAGLLETGKGSSFSSRQTVQYLHRTVRDYLDRPDVLDNFLERTARTGFEPYTAALRAYVIQLKNWDLGLLTPTTLKNFQTTALLYAHEADIVHQKSNIELLDILSATVLDLITARPQLESNSERGLYSSTKRDRGRLRTAIKWDLCLYVDEKLRQQSINADWAGKPLLNYALPEDCESRHRLRPSPRMVALLISHGASPNQRFGGLTPFKSMIMIILETALPEGSVEYPPEIKREMSDHLRIIETMLEHGSDTSACLQCDGEYKTVRRLLRERFSKYWPTEAPKVDAMFAKYGGSMELSIYQRWVSAD
jgi:hypothetical protein